MVAVTTVLRKTVDAGLTEPTCSIRTATTSRLSFGRACEEEQTEPRPMTPHNHLEYVIEEGLNRINWSRVHGWLTSSYWSPGIRLEQIDRAARHSALILGAFKNEEQVGYLRVISDKTRFAYLCDVWVETAHRRRGVAQAMIRYAIEHPDLATVNWLLATADAHALYASL